MGTPTFVEPTDHIFEVAVCCGKEASIETQVPRIHKYKTGTCGHKMWKTPERTKLSSVVLATKLWGILITSKLIDIWVKLTIIDPKVADWKIKCEHICIPFCNFEPSSPVEGGCLFCCTMVNHYCLGFCLTMKQAKPNLSAKRVDSWWRI